MLDTLISGDALLILLITLPVSIPADFPRDSPYVLSRLKAITAEWGLTGSTDVWRSQYLDGEILWLRAAYRELRHAPPLYDADRLPPHWVCERNHHFSEARLRWLRARRGWGLWQVSDLEQEITRGQARADWWYEASLAVDKTQWVRCRRRALVMLRNGLGEACYSAGDWPAP